MSSGKDSTEKDMRQLIALIADYNRQSQAARKAGESEIGAFFVYKGEVVKTGTPLSVVGLHGLFKSKTYDHEFFWKSLQRLGAVSCDIEYNEVPRGRVEYDADEEQFHIYADLCILKDRRAMEEISREFHLPSTDNGEPKRDPRYTCSGCGDSQESDS
jgi:hypothetical protein